MTEQQFPTPEPLDLHVDIGSGSVHVLATTTAESAVVATGPGADQLEVRHTGASLSITQPRGRFFRTDTVHLRLTVPTGSRPSVRTGSASVTLEGRYGETRVRCGSGDVHATSVAGSASVSTGSGDITVDEVTADLTAKAGSGDVRIGLMGGSAVVATGSGDVTVERAQGEVAVKTGSGDVRVGESHEEVSVTTGSGSLTVLRALRGRVFAKTASGSVQLGVPPGLPVWTDISTVSGHVRSDLEGVGEPGEGAERLEVHARTVSGGVHLLPSE